MITSFWLLVSELERHFVLSFVFLVSLIVCFKVGSGLQAVCVGCFFLVTNVLVNDIFLLLLHDFYATETSERNLFVLQE